MDAVVEAVDAYLSGQAFYGMADPACGEAVHEMLVAYLVEELRRQPDLRQPSLVAQAAALSRAVHVNVDEGRLVADARARTVDEARLQARHAILPAAEARVRANAHREQQEALQYSGLPWERLEAMTLIHRAVQQGETKVSIEVEYDDYADREAHPEDEAVVPWLEALGYRVQPTWFGHRYFFDVSW